MTKLLRSAAVVGVAHAFLYGTQQKKQEKENVAKVSDSFSANVKVEAHTHSMTRVIRKFEKKQKQHILELQDIKVDLPALLTIDLESLCKEIWGDLAYVEQELEVNVEAVAKTHSESKYVGPLAELKDEVDVEVQVDAVVRDAWAAKFTPDYRPYGVLDTLQRNIISGERDTYRKNTYAVPHYGGAEIRQYRKAVEQRNEHMEEFFRRKRQLRFLEYRLAMDQRQCQLLTKLKEDMTDGGSTENNKKKMMELAMDQLEKMDVEVEVEMIDNRAVMDKLDMISAVEDTMVDTNVSANLRGNGGVSMDVAADALVSLESNLQSVDKKASIKKEKARRGE